MKFLKYMGVIILSVIVIIVSYVYYLSVQRDTSTWVEDIQVSENVKIPIEIMTSQRKFYGNHIFGWGGGDDTGYIKFNYNGITYYDNAPHTSIVIKLYKDNFYIVYYDRETDFSKITFKFFKSQTDGKFLEIKATEFPKHLAIQNRWFSSHESSNNKKENLIGLNPKKMRGTMTVDIWYMIEGKQSILTDNTRIPIEFIEKYKEENFTNRKNEN